MSSFSPARGVEKGRVLHDKRLGRVGGRENCHHKLLRVGGRGGIAQGRWGGRDLLPQASDGDVG